jgi:hypothetical protein
MRYELNDFCPYNWALHPARLTTTNSALSY